MPSHPRPHRTLRPFQPLHALWLAALTATLLPAGLAAAQCPLSFSPALHTPTILNPERPVAADFDGDGRPDLAFVPSSSTLGLHIQWGLGDGTFEPPAFIFPAARIALQSADFNGDGSPDLILSEPGPPRTLRVLLSGPGRTFTPAAPAELGITSFIMDLTVGDFDGDGSLDAAGISFDSPQTLTLVRGDGAGNLTPGPTVTLTPPPDQAAINVAAGRIDDDRADELIVTMSSANGTRILVGRLSDWSSRPDFFGTHDLAMSHTRTAVADLNGDGRTDLILPFRLANSLAGVAVLAGTESGDLEAPRTFLAGTNTPLAVAAADLDGDGDADVITTRPTFRVWTNDGSGALSPALFDSAPVGTLSVTTSDFNRDGRPDLAFTTTIGPNTLDIIPNAGPLAFVRPLLDPIYTCPNSSVNVQVFIPRMVNPPISWQFLGERGWAPMAEGAAFTTPDGQPFGVPSHTDATTLEVRTLAGCCQHHGTARVRCLVTSPCGTTIGPPIRLIICRPDFTCDGFLDFFDYDGFVESFLAGDPSTDFNNDNFLDFFDYDDFVASFESGC